MHFHVCKVVKYYCMLLIGIAVVVPLVVIAIVIAVAVCVAVKCRKYKRLEEHVEPMELEKKEGI